MTTDVEALDAVRERVLEAACRLFAGRGINTTGVDLVSEAAGVSKRSLYQRFPSKDHLIAAYLPRATERFLDGVIPPEDSGLSPAARILEVFAATQRKSHEPGFRGCPVLNATAEISDMEHPVRDIAVGYKEQLTTYFTRQAEAAGAAAPALLAEQLTMVFDGAMAYASVRGKSVPDSVHVTVRTLLSAQGLRLPSQATKA
ncbi:TetR/AcrR family transcriptional regulator [Streptosporangium sp. NPDC048865]|uniref:TetR/AcrR family transcriptional regulator n=1 Tax=Streptosporangium sp. NPDC048865 TaxID=3155766 RepID=UPI0034238C4B